MHLKLTKNTRYLIAIILVSCALIFQACFFGIGIAKKELAPYSIIVFVINTTIVGMLLFSLFKKETKALYAVYLIVKTADGVCNPIVGFINTEAYDSSYWAIQGKAITFLIAAAALFLTIIFIFINQYSRFAYSHFVIEILTLISVLAVALNMVFTIIAVVDNKAALFEIFEVLFDLFLFSSLYVISPLVHEGEHKKVKEEN